MFRRFTVPQMLLASLVGIAGGFYIYKPIYEQYYWDNRTTKETEDKPQEEKNQK
ncbi:protein PIGBOS1 [Pleurodeles waltl]|uniref:protein PIGBOS1 n=1 Tax=Pleurodeles waltl TaxID=8319 RepID=UPI0037095B37